MDSEEELRLSGNYAINHRWEKVKALFASGNYSEFDAALAEYVPRVRGNRTIKELFYRYFIAECRKIPNEKMPDKQERIRKLEREMASLKDEVLVLTTDELINP